MRLSRRVLLVPEFYLVLAATQRDRHKDGGLRSKCITATRPPFLLKYRQAVLKQHWSSDIGFREFFSLLWAVSLHFLYKFVRVVRYASAIIAVLPRVTGFGIAWNGYSRFVCVLSIMH